MNIGIIGAGNIGRELAKKFVSLGHNVSVSNSRGPETLLAVANETGARPVSVREAVRDKDVVVIAIAEDAITRLPHDLFSTAAAGTIVVDAGNYYPDVRDVRIAEIEHGMPESEWVSQQLGVPVIKAFNALTVWSLRTRGLPPGAPGRIALPVAGDNQKDKEVILELVHGSGFDGLDAGTLAESWCLQPGAPGYCVDLDAAALTAALGKADPARINDYRNIALGFAKQAVEEAGSLAAAMANAGKPVE